MTALLCGRRTMFADALSSYLVLQGQPVDSVKPDPLDVLTAALRPGVRVLLFVDALPLLDPSWAAALRELREATAVRVLLIGRDAAVSQKALATGLIDGVLPRGSGLAELLDALKAGRPDAEPPAGAGSGPHEGSARRGLAGSAVREQPWTAAQVLSRREREVADLLAEGRSTADIAAELDVSRNTVHTHVQSMLRKLGARNRIEAVNRYLTARHRLDLCIAS